MTTKQEAPLTILTTRCSRSIDDNCQELAQPELKANVSPSQVFVYYDASPYFAEDENKDRFITLTEAGSPKRLQTLSQFSGAFALLAKNLEEAKKIMASVHKHLGGSDGKKSPEIGLVLDSGGIETEAIQRYPFSHPLIKQESLVSMAAQALKVVKETVEIKDAELVYFVGENMRPVLAYKVTLQVPEHTYYVLIFDANNGSLLHKYGGPVE